MKGRDYDRLLESGLRRKLTPEEELELESYYASHPESRREFEEETRLNLLLRNLPNHPVASNFTARVLQAAAAGTRSPGSRPWRFPLLSFQWLRSTALVTLVISLGLFSYYQYQVSVRVERAESVAAVSSVATLPTLEMLEHFDEIHRLSHAPEGADLDFLLTSLP